MDIKKEFDKATREVSKWTKDHKDDLIVGGILVGTAVAGGVVGCKIKTHKIEKELSKVIKTTNNGNVMVSRIVDNWTGEVAEVVTMTHETLGEIINMAKKEIVK